MSRIYKRRITEDKTGLHFYITVKCAQGHLTEVEVSESLFAELEAMQREIWRLDRQTRRFCEYLSRSEEEQSLRGTMRAAGCTASPEDLFLERLRVDDLRVALIQALLALSPTQARRFLLHHGIGLTYRQIARIDRCSENSVKTSILLAKQGLRKILGKTWRK